jgi:hypothetical protein
MATLTGFETDFRISYSCAILTERANQRVNHTCKELARCTIRANKRTSAVRFCPTFRRSDNPHARVEWSIGVQWQSGRGLHPHVRDRSQIRQYPIDCRSEVTPETIRPPERDQRWENKSSRHFFSDECDGSGERRLPACRSRQLAEIGITASPQSRMCEGVVGRAADNDRLAACVLQIRMTRVIRGLF